jgi:hypothetical protein
MMLVSRAYFRMMVTSGGGLLRSQAAGAAQQVTARMEGICESAILRGNCPHRTLLCVKLSCREQDIASREIALRRVE